MNKIIFKPVLLIVSLILFYSLSFAVEKSAKSSILINMQSEPPQNKLIHSLNLPVYLSELTNINDYNIFANGGWDGSWYAGYNVCWIEMIPQPPKGEYRKAYIGAKLGRTKTQNVPKRPIWEKEPIPGEIDMALSSSPSWKASQSYFLTQTKDIPCEADYENALEGVGEARWFWAEVPIKEVNFEGPNYIALWSPTPFFVSTSSSPVLAGGWGSKKVNSWLNNEIRGYPPLDLKASLKTAITIFEPAICLKLIPAGTEQDIEVTIVDIKDGRDGTANKTLVVSIIGNEIEKAWLEVSIKDSNEWEKHGGYVYGAPYFFTLKADNLPAGSLLIRCSAQDIWGNIGSSAPVEISVTR
ncbi:MAG: hypothetical protein LHV68_05390 [Elusimicrobia bacterium]|nr:hypothetical protein [Candidatus Liberimonas magnetica]